MKKDDKKKRPLLLKLLDAWKDGNKRNRARASWWHRFKPFMMVTAKTAHRDRRRSTRRHARLKGEIPYVRGLKLLNEVPPGECVIVRKIYGGKDFSSRMAALGFTIGVEVKVVQNFGHGPMIVTVRDTRVALGRGQAIKIQVEVI